MHLNFILNGKHIQSRNFCNFMKHFVGVLVSYGHEIFVRWSSIHFIKMKYTVPQFILFISCVMNQGWGPLIAVFHQQSEVQAGGCYV